MNIKDKENADKNIQEKNELSSDEKEENSFDDQTIILGFEEHPDIVIEKILINVFNSITNKNTNEKYIPSYQKKN